MTKKNFIKSLVALPVLIAGYLKGAQIVAENDTVTDPFLGIVDEYHTPEHRFKVSLFIDGKKIDLPDVHLTPLKLPNEQDLIKKSPEWETITANFKS